MNIENKAQREWSKIAKEEVEVQDLSGTLYAFGSEIACLRLLSDFRHSGERAGYGYSENQKSHYFRLEPHA